MLGLCHQHHADPAYVTTTTCHQHYVCHPHVSLPLRVTSIVCHQHASTACHQHCSCHALTWQAVDTGEPSWLVWRCLLQADSERRQGQLSAEVLLDRLKALRTQSYKAPWVVILSRGGHFVGAVFDVKPQARGSSQGGKHEVQPFEILAHKTLHRYVVRCVASALENTLAAR